ncbi:hypothetical protein ILUMI_21094 [Ignelater luminosus]|uniref:Ribosomal protein n=1 Tax=Ignelater luminosus TaxID=2038154 RepID=A0A8K0G3Y4_IGNLU|nr:hypothetical protein ILUMI_21094 [Ignelater luminosus]
MYSILRTILWNTTKSLSSFNLKTNSNLFHSLSKGYYPQQITYTKELLSPSSISFIPNCGFKVKVALKKRCKDCYFVRRENRLHVICKTHPRHKQMQMVKREKNTWILSHATQSKSRPW